MQNSPSSHHYGSSTGQEIPRLLENQTGDDNYKTTHTKIWTKYTLYQYTNTGVCVLCCRLLCTEQPSTHSYHKPNKNNPIPTPLLFLSNTDCYTILQCLQNGSSCSGFLK